MKQKIRINVFETNSSSIHDLAICEMDQVDEHIDPETYEDEIDTDGQFGWGLEYVVTPHAKLSYLYLLACYCAGYQLDFDPMDNLKAAFPRVFFKEHKSYKYPDVQGYIDHESNKVHLLRTALRDPEEFINKAVIILENDNSDYEGTIERWLKKHNAKIVDSGGN